MNATRTLTYLLIGLVVLLQYPLWFGSGGLIASWRLQREIEVQQAENARLAERNLALSAEVVDLKKGLTAIEERARTELGMIKQGETFFQVIETPAGN